DVDDLYLSSIWVTVPAKYDVLYTENGKTYFDYDIKEDNMENYANTTAGEPKVPTTQEDRVYKFTCPRDFTASYKVGNTTYDYTKLVRVPKSGQLTVAIMLPPMKDLDLRDLTIDVKSAGFGTNKINLSESSNAAITVTAGSKAKLVLPKWEFQDFVNMGQSKLLWATCNMVKSNNEPGDQTPLRDGDYWQQSGAISAATTYNTNHATTDGSSYRLPVRTELEHFQATGSYTWNYRTYSKTKIYTGVSNAKDLLKPDAGDACEQAWVKMNRTTDNTLINGYLVTSLTTGNCVFIPATGYGDPNQGGRVQSGTYGINANLWTSSTSGSNGYYLAADRRGYNDGTGTLYKKFVVETATNRSYKPARLVKVLP
ncbi:MAG: hypothetical protein HUK02_03355, partial [Bacteroidaceae bacterium]|nr:hypothetical protein [Bacteroidaceae bacterium]